MISKYGVSASPGVAIGPALVLDAEEYRIPRRTVDPAQAPRQIEVLQEALETSRQEVSELRSAAARKLGEQTADIFAFHEGFIADPKLAAEAIGLIQSKHFAAAYAFAQVMSKRRQMFQSVAVEYLKERVRDLFDIEKRVLRHILGRAREDLARLTEPVVIVAHDITPSQAVGFDRETILGLVIDVGGATSHTAIIARMLDIPTVVALNDVTNQVSGGETLIVDGGEGLVIVNPDEETITRYRGKQRRQTEAEVELKLLRDAPAETQDGQSITLWCNIELADEASKAIERGAQGIGLYRTEFLFLASERVPTEEQQFEAFRSAVQSIGERPLLIRTVDLGADKLAPSLGMTAHEPNPVLGLRSLRYCLRNLDLFKTHLRAILRASAFGDVRIMFPMITTLSELRQAKSTVNDVAEDLEEEGLAFRRNVPVGMMVETPAAAMLSSSFAREVDFMSVGTNDLTQYTLAVDRANERVAHLYSQHNPAVLRLIRQVILAGLRTQTTVSICGEMAGNPLYCLLLVGMGVRNLSMSPKNVPEIKRLIRGVSLAECKRIAAKTLRLDSDRQILSFLKGEHLRLTGGEVSE